MHEYDVWEFGYTKDQVKQLCKGLNDYLQTQGVHIFPATTGRWGVSQTQHDDRSFLSELPEYFETPYEAVIGAFKWVEKIKGYEQWVRNIVKGLQISEVQVKAVPESTWYDIANKSPDLWYSVKKLSDGIPDSVIAKALLLLINQQLDSQEILRRFKPL